MIRSESPTSRSLMPRSRAAHAGVVADAKMWCLVLDGVPIDRRSQARTLLACHHAADTAVEVTAVAHRLAAAPPPMPATAWDWALNDIHTARQHILFGHGSRGVLGQILAGRDLAMPPLIV